MCFLTFFGEGIVQIGCQFKHLSLGRAMQKSRTTLTDMVFTFNLRSSCMAKEEFCSCEEKKKVFF